VAEAGGWDASPRGWESSQPGLHQRNRKDNRISAGMTEWLRTQTWERRVAGSDPTPGTYAGPPRLVALRRDARWDRRSGSRPGPGRSRRSANRASANLRTQQPGFATKRAMGRSAPPRSATKPTPGADLSQVGPVALARIALRAFGERTVALRVVGERTCAGPAEESHWERNYHIFRPVATRVGTDPPKLRSDPAGAAVRTAPMRTSPRRRSHLVGGGCEPSQPPLVVVFAKPIANPHSRMPHKSITIAPETREHATFFRIR